MEEHAKIRDEVKPFIWWQVKAGNSSFWFDCALYYIDGELAKEEEMEVRSLITNNTWNSDVLRDTVSEELHNSIIHTIRPAMREKLDRPW